MTTTTTTGIVARWTTKDLLTEMGRAVTAAKRHHREGNTDGLARYADYLDNMSDELAARSSV